MMRKFTEGVVFGAGFAIAFMVVWYAAAFWVMPALTTSRIDRINRELSEPRPPGENHNPGMAAGDVDEIPFHEMAIEEQIKASSVIALARYEKAADGKMRAVIKEFLKKDPETTVHYDVGDEYANSSYYPKENALYGDGVIIFFAGSPAMMRMSMTFSGDRISGLGDLPLVLFREKCEKSKESQGKAAMTQKSFRTLILLYIALGVASIAAAFLPTGYSQELTDAVDNEPMSPLADNLWLMLGLFLPLVLAAFAGMYGLFMFKRWGRWLSLYSTLAGLIVFPLFGPSLQGGIESALYEASTLMWGAILALSYYSAVSSSFTGSADQVESLGVPSR